MGRGDVMRRFVVVKGLWCGLRSRGDACHGFGPGRRGSLSGLLWLHGTDETIAGSLAADPISLSLFHGGGVALHADPEFNAEIEGLFVGET